MNTTKKIKRLKLAIVVLSLIILIPILFITTLMIIGYYNDSGEFGALGYYPLSKLKELNIQYLDLREIEELPNALDDGANGTIINTNIPFANHVNVARRQGTNSFLSFNQSIIEDDYQASLQMFIAIGSSQKKFEKFFDEDAYVNIFFGNSVKKVYDDRFETLVVHLSDNEIQVKASRGLKAMGIRYSGKHEAEFFIEKLAEMLE